MLGTLSLVCAVCAAWSWQELRFETQRADELENALAAARAQFRAAPVPNHETTLDTSSGRSSVPAAVAPTDVQATAARPTPEVTTRPQQDIRPLLRAAQQREAELRRDPEYRKTLVERLRRELGRTRADAIRVVGMTPAQADRIIDLWIERDLGFTEYGGVPGEPPNESVQARITSAREPEQAELKSVLGAAKYELWNRYLANAPERGEINQFNRQLPDPAQALTEQQVDVVVDSVVQERQRAAREYEDYVKAAGITDRYVVSANDRQRYLDIEYAANQRVHDAMSGTLSVAQLAALDDLLKARLAPSEATLRMQLGGKSSGPD